MNEIKRSVKIEAPREKVFAYASNYLNWTEFFEGVSSVKPITELTRSNGSKFIYKVKVLGMNMTVGTEFREFKENEGWKGKSFKGLEHATQWIFEKSNGATEFTFIQSYICPWYLGGKFIDDRFIFPTWERIIENSLQNVKRIMEEK